MLLRRSAIALARRAAIVPPVAVQRSFISFSVVRRGFLSLPFPFYAPHFAICSAP